MTNATIIIGLLVLLTFSSVASPFGQEERSAFFADWYELKRNLNSGDLFLAECNQLVNDEIKLQESYTVALSPDLEKINEGYDDYRGDGSFPVDAHEDYKITLLDACSTAAVEKLQFTYQLEELDRWGMDMKYLQYNTTDKSQLVESQYHKDLASGPYSVNMINLAMIIPFLLSAIVDTIISSRKKDIDSASNVGIGLMVTGFVIVVIGLVLIGISFYQAASPFL